MNQNFWDRYNNDFWSYEEIRQFGRTWSLVLCKSKKYEQVDVQIFHLPCLPEPRAFQQNFNGLTHDSTDTFTIGAVATNGRCDKCNIGRIQMKYRKLARFVFPNYYEEEPPTEPEEIE